MNRAQRRAQDRCKHIWLVKEFPKEGKDYRWCERCGREEWRGRLVPGDAADRVQP